MRVIFTGKRKFNNWSCQSSTFISINTNQFSYPCLLAFTVPVISLQDAKLCEFNGSIDAPGEFGLDRGKRQASHPLWTIMWGRIRLQSSLRKTFNFSLPLLWLRCIIRWRLAFGWISSKTFQPLLANFGILLYFFGFFCCSSLFFCLLSLSWGKNFIVSTFSHLNFLSFNKTKANEKIFCIVLKLLYNFYLHTLVG